MVIWYHTNRRIISRIVFIETDDLLAVSQHRDRIKAILKSIILLGKYNIALRWWKAENDLTEQSSINEVNLRELIRHPINTCGHDAILKLYFELAATRTKYVSPSIQNELINCFGNEILIKKGKYYRIIFDETTDNRHPASVCCYTIYRWEIENSWRFCKFSWFP